MIQNKSIAIIGAGNVATHLSLAFKNVGFEILQVYSRTIEKAQKLADLIHTSCCSEISDITTKADVYFFCIKDDALSDILNKLIVGNKLFIHTSGSIEMDVFKGKSDNYGVIYPFQTISKNVPINFKTVSLCIEANNKETSECIRKLAQTISNHVYELNSENRQFLHIAAVFAGNFTNHMYSLAFDLLNKKGLSTDLIKPLMNEIVNKATNYPPFEVQTGPAVRNDKIIMKRHVELLKSDKVLQKMYRFVSKSIIKFHKRDE